MSVRRRARGRWRWVALLVVAAVVGAGCSSGGDDDAEPGGRKATGPPVLVGLINMEDTPVGSFPELRQGAEAALRYVNQELGGVGGRPLKIDVCTTTGTPESSRACANRLLRAKPVAVLGGVDVGAGASLTLLERAKVPYVGASPTLFAELTSPSSFMLAGGTAAELLAQAAYVTDELRPARVGIVHLDLPGLLSQAAEVARTVLQKKGVGSVRIAAEKSDAPDFTPAVTTVTQGDPDVVFAVFPAQGCSRVMESKEALGVKARFFYPGACADRSVAETAGPAAEGAYFATSFVPYDDPADEQVALYRAQLEANGGEVAPSVLSQTGFSLVMDVRALLDELAPDRLTPAAVTSALRGAKNRPSFMGHPYTCDGTQVPFLASICRADVRIVQLRDGRLRDVAGDWVNGADLIDLILG